MAITVAEKVLIVGGVLNLAYVALLGYPITVTGGVTFRLRKKD